MLVAVAEPESATEASDAELAGRVRGGDRAAEAELFRRLAPRVRLYGLRHLRDPAAADDLVQDVLLMTFDSLRAGKVREDERLASYVLGTCRRMAIGLARSTTRRQRLLERFGPELAPAAWTFASPSLDLDRLVSCLERLAERERTVVVLSFYADRGAAEIASELGLSPSTCAWCATARWRACAGAWRRGRDSRLALPRAAGPCEPR
jgi:RNA polymerase sigma-70 factor (ECF subfamily)